MRKGLILYGAPATGKDTITAELVHREPCFEHFKRLKFGSGRSAGYRMIDHGQAQILRQSPEMILWENSRYGSTYFVDRPGLERVWDLGRVPVVHLGQVEAVEAIARDSASGAIWTVVELHCQPAILYDRIRSRQTGDDVQRFAAVAHTNRLPVADIRIDTGSVPVAEAAEKIADLVHRSS
ncbi:kinase [Micromonospora violae]|uniref:kinase n=1 Tax=Micromonospora violae TaxID=1278207 RepID=UPI00102B2E94|nr:kinase [Micromonospora violae]